MEGSASCVHKGRIEIAVMGSIPLLGGPRRGSRKYQDSRALGWYYLQYDASSPEGRAETVVGILLGSVGHILGRARHLSRKVWFLEAYSQQETVMATSRIEH